jgi:LAO/AO transport system kinase
MSLPDPESLAKRVRSGDRRALARAITLVESTRADHRALAAGLLENLAELRGTSIRIGISGVPGVGKSTFIESFGMHVLGAGHRVAVLSVDPTSALSGGSILGDKTRMPELAREEAAFIRPSPAGSALGGVSRHTRESILLCEAAGFDLVLVETVGVGQSETAVSDMTDMFLLLLLPGAGDELQGIKRGIVELADLVLVNKADGELEASAGRTAAEYRNALRLLRPRSPGWNVPVETCSALTGGGIAEVWSLVLDFHARLQESGEIHQRRAMQSRAWMWAEISDSLIAALKAHPGARAMLDDVEQAVVDGKLSPTRAAGRLVDVFVGKGDKDRWAKARSAKKGRKR